MVKEDEETYQPVESLEKKILSVFNGKPLTAKEILIRLELDLTSQKLHNMLKGLAQVEIIKTKRPYKFQLRDKFDHSQQKSLFE